MPSVLGNSPFLSLRSDDSCGRSHDNTHSNQSSDSTIPYRSSDSSNRHSSSHAYSNAKSNGHGTHSGDTNGTHNDEFLKLDTPQQDVLMLHGPRQRYSLEKAQKIPELKNDREMLIQVLAIGLNPVDWKGADYGTVTYLSQVTLRRSICAYGLTRPQGLASLHTHGSTAETLLASSCARPAPTPASRSGMLSVDLPQTIATCARPPIKNISSLRTSMSRAFPPRPP